MPEWMRRIAILSDPNTSVGLLPYPLPRHGKLALPRRPRVEDRKLGNDDESGSIEPRSAHPVTSSMHFDGDLRPGTVNRTDEAVPGGQQWDRQQIGFRGDPNSDTELYHRRGLMNVLDASAVQSWITAH
jgi:hypothetical protein